MICNLVVKLSECFQGAARYYIGSAKLVCCFAKYYQSPTVTEGSSRGSLWGYSKTFHSTCADTMTNDDKTTLTSPRFPSGLCIS